jgi:hypothetical protein
MQSNWGWRLPSLLQVVPSALQIIFGYFLPESPRWLVARGRGEEAYEILAKYHAEGDVESELVKAEYVQIEKTLEAEKETARVGWTDLLSTSGMRKRILVGSALGVFTQWSGNGLTSYVWSFTYPIKLSQSCALDTSSRVSSTMLESPTTTLRTLSTWPTRSGASPMLLYSHLPCPGTREGRCIWSVSTFHRAQGKDSLFLDLLNLSALDFHWMDDC